MKIGEIYIGNETGCEVELMGFAGDLVKYEFCNPSEGFTGIQFCTKEDFERTTRLKGKQTKEEFLRDYWASIEPIPEFINKDWFDAVPCPHCPDCGEWLLIFKEDKKRDK